MVEAFLRRLHDRDSDCDHLIQLLLGSRARHRCRLYQVESIVKSMASNKAPGIDKVPIRVIKDCLPAILPSITSIINATFESAIFPNMWKIAVVTPIPKEGDDEVPNNNRPISLLPVLSKVCERVAHNQFSSYLLSRDHLSCKQSGNKQWHSTETSFRSTQLIQFCPQSTKKN